jgi:RimJ/RimL family protein N-acetyltransferase
LYTGKLVRLRAYEKSDISTILQFLNDPEVKRLMNPGIPYPITVEDEEKWLASNSSLKETYSFAIETLEDGKYIGGCGINEINWKNSWATIGIFIGDKNYWGRGYGTDAIDTLVKFIFEQLNINKIKLEVFSFNERAINSYKKVGFKVEGVLREELFRDGKYHDILIMGLLRKEYLKG